MLKNLKGNNILYNIQIILFFTLLYYLIKKSQSSRDIILMGGLILVTIIRNYKEKIYLKISRKTFLLVIMYTTYIVLNYLFLSKNYNNIVTFKMCESLIKSFILFLLMTQIKFNKNIQNLICPLFLLGTLNPIIKGLIIIKKVGFFKSRIGIWENPNYYSMILGIFIIISIFSFFKYKSYFIKSLSCFVFITSFVIIAGLTQSKTAFLGVLAVLFIFSFDVLKGKFIKWKIGLGIIFILFLLFLWNQNARILTTFKLNHILHDGRLKLWNIGINKFLEEKNYLFGLGIGYFSNNLIDFHGIKLGALHNDFIETLVTQGLIGVILYYSVLCNFLCDLYKKISENEFAKIGIYCIIYLTIIGMSDIANLSLRVPQLIFLICGLGINNSLKTNVYENRRGGETINE